MATATSAVSEPTNEGSLQLWLDFFFLKEKENRIAASVKALDHLMSKMASFK